MLNITKYLRNSFQVDPEYSALLLSTTREIIGCSAAITDCVLCSCLSQLAVVFIQPTWSKLKLRAHTDSLTRRTHYYLGWTLTWLQAGLGWAKTEVWQLSFTFSNLKSLIFYFIFKYFLFLIYCKQRNPFLICKSDIRIHICNF